jgi:hypothetical protein
LEAIIEILDQNLLSAIKQSFLGIIFSSKLRKHEAGILAQRRILENFFGVFVRFLHESRVKIIFVLLDKIGPVSHRFGVQRLPHDVSFLEIIVPNGFQTLDIGIFTVALV